MIHQRFGQAGRCSDSFSPLLLQLLAFVLLGLVFFEQAGQHGPVWLGVGTAGPPPGLRGLGYAFAPPEGGPWFML